MSEKIIIAVCDDKPEDRQYIAALAAAWGQEQEQDVALDTYTGAEEYLFRSEEDPGPDILLFDLEMGPMDGLTVAKNLREKNDWMQIVFITGYTDYIAEGYDVAALHYLVKPVRAEKLYSVLDRAAGKLKKNALTLTVSTPGETLRIPIRQIRYAEVRQNYVTVHAKEDHTFKMPLRDLKDQLDERFYQVGRSAVVNLTCIARVTKSEITLTDGTKIQLPRGAYEGVNRAIINME